MIIRGRAHLSTGSPAQGTLIAHHLVIRERIGPRFCLTAWGALSGYVPGVTAATAAAEPRIWMFYTSLWERRASLSGARLQSTFFLVSGLVALRLSLVCMSGTGLYSVTVAMVPEFG